MISTVMQLQRNVIREYVVGERFLIVTWNTCNVFVIVTRPHPCRCSDDYAGLRVASSWSLRSLTCIILHVVGTWSHL